MPTFGRETKIQSDSETNLTRSARWAKWVAGVLFSHKGTEITVETARLVIIRRCHARRAWCVSCGHDVDMVGTEDAGAIAGIEQPMLRAESTVRSWHVCEGPKGEFLVCLDSLLSSL